MLGLQEMAQTHTGHLVTVDDYSLNGGYER